MNLRLPAMAAAFAAIQVALCPHGASAAERCPGMTIEVDAAFRGHWPDLIERIEKELSARADADACARVDLRVEGDSAFTVTVTLPDGRAAARSVTDRDDIIPTFNSGDNTGAATAFAAFLSQHPRDLRAEDAAYLRILSLQRAGDSPGAQRAAHDYLSRYPHGFRRAEVEALLR